MPRVPKDKLVDTLIEMAQSHLKKLGGFHPFAMALDPNNEGRIVVANTSEELVDPEGEINVILNVLRNEAAGGRLQAYAICGNGGLDAQGPSGWARAIKIMLEDPSTGLNIYLPYKEGRTGLLKRRTYTYGERFVTPGKRPVFG